MATYVNDLRLTELATGEGSGTWGTTTNVNLELIGEALGYGTQDCFASDADATTTVADGVSDPARAMYFKVTSSATLTATRTLTIAPNTVSRVMLIENATTGSQSIAISQGTGGNVTIASGQVKMVYLDGAGSGAAVVDAMASLELGTITVANLTATTADINGGTIDGATIGGASAAAGTFTTLNATGGGSLTGTWTDLGTVTTVDINGGTIDGADITVGSGKTLDVSGGTLTLANDQISGDKIQGGTIGSITITSLASTTVDTTNIEVTNLKAKDGTAAGSIADSTGVVTLSSSVLTTTDINGGTIDGTTIGGSTPAAGSFTTVSATGNITVGGTVDGRDVASDGTKLDTVETNADVTDTANVTAAGALMDSELTDIAAVKALDQGVATTDSPSFAGLTATTADINGGTIDGAAINDTTIGATTPSTGDFTTLTENDTPVVIQTDIGTDPNQVPLNQYLGSMAYVDSENATLDVGAGITSGAICKANAGLSAGIYKATILIDLTGLNSGDTAGDIIGVNGSSDPAYIARLPAMTVLGGRMTCLETPAGGDTDLDLYSATEGTGTEDSAITGLTETQIINAGAQTAGTVTYFSADPAANAYLYLVGQSTSDATYTAGRFLIEIFGA